MALGHRSIDPDVKLSKRMSKALRHAPERVGLVLDAEGFVLVDDLARALSTPERTVTREDFERVMATSNKQRYQIEGNKIRAVYGHTVEEKISYEPVTPPDVLYHGTPRANIDAIRRDGLLPMGRQYAHLSADLATARRVGQRRDASPAIFVVDAAHAAASGVAFYYANDTTWLADAVPSAYLRLLAE